MSTGFNRFLSKRQSQNQSSIFSSYFNGKTNREAFLNNSNNKNYNIFQQNGYNIANKNVEYDSTNVNQKKTSQTIG